jgi:hypothetical protein
MSCKFVSTMLHGTHQSQIACGMISWFVCTRMFGSCHAFHLEKLVQTRMVFQTNCKCGNNYILHKVSTCLFCNVQG